MPLRLNPFANVPRRNLIFFATLGVVLAALFFAMVQIPGMARAKITDLLKSAGFEDARVTSVFVRPNGLRAANIKLDRYGFDDIKLLQVDLNWLKFLTTDEISGVTIKGMSIARQPENLSSSSRQLVTNLLNLPDYRVAVTDAVIDLGTDFGDIRLKADIAINGAANAKGRDIKAHITGDQYQLGFDSRWEGSLNDEGQLELSANIEDGRLNIGPLRVSRFNGWFGASAAKDGYNIQSQMEAGSATFMNIPLHDLSLVNDHSLTQSSVIFRSGISGLPDVLYTADFLENDKGEMFTSIFKGENIGRTLHYIGEQTKNKNAVPSALDKSSPFEFQSQFQPDRRFVGGPLPFSLTLNIGGKKQADGNMLFYPENYDVRGSIETNTDMASALQSYFHIPSENMKQNFIRLDGSTKNFFHLAQEKDKQAAK